MRKVYLDHNATTPIHPDVLREMEGSLRFIFGNPSTLYKPGKEAREKLNEARARVATLIGVHPEEVIFTSGGTEANNLALFGIAKNHRKKGGHIISTRIEHDSVLNACSALDKEGFEITYLPVDSTGMIDPQDLEDAIRPDTILISIMHSNNEVGTIQPIKEMVDIAREKDVLFHTDAVQSIGKIDLNVQELGVDLLSIASHKIYGPKGVGALYIKRDVAVQPILYGGHQEKGLRAGTENIPGIVGFGKACEIVAREREGDRLKGLRDRLYNALKGKIDRIRLNGHPTQRLPNTLNISVESVEGEGIILELDRLGIYAGVGSACATRETSHVLTAMGVPIEIARGALRFSLGRDNREEDIDYVIEVLPKVVERLRGISPFYNPN